METKGKNVFCNCCSKGVGFGIVLMLIGVVFLGFNFGLIPKELKNVIISWQMLLIIVGIVHLFTRRFVSGTCVLFIGLFFMIPKIVPGIDGNFVHIYWPLLLIGAGIVILLKRLLMNKTGFESRSDRWSHKNINCSNQKYSKWEQSQGGFSKNSVFSNAEHIVLDDEFKGGELNAIFGELLLDLRRTNLPEGETRLEVNAVFGGIKVFVPSDWLVETHLDAVFGGFQDNRIPQNPTDSSRKLIITGSCVFGGGEIRN